MKIAFVTSRFPFPLEKGDKLRSYQLAKALAKHHDVYLFAIHDTHPKEEAIKHLNQFCTRVYNYVLPVWRRNISLAKNMFSPLPFHVAYFYDSGIKNKLQSDIEAIHPDLIFCHLIRVSEYVKSLDYPKLLDYMDAFSKIIRLEKEKLHGFSKPVWQIEYTRTKNYEIEISQYFDKLLCISTGDQKAIASDNEIEVLKNGIDLDFFKHKTADQNYELVFVGNLGYKPNIEAACFIVHEILPILEKMKLDVNLLVAGARPTRKVKQLKAGNVSILKWPEDIRVAYRSGKVFVAPIFLGSGLQNKILEAMAMGVPCITTSKVNEAIGAIERKEIMIADTAHEFAIKIKTLLTNADLHRQIQQNAINFVNTNYSWEKVGKKLNEIILEIVK